MHTQAFLAVTILALSRSTIASPFSIITDPLQARQVAPEAEDPVGYASIACDRSTAKKGTITASAEHPTAQENLKDVESLPKVFPAPYKGNAPVTPLACKLLFESSGTNIRANQLDAIDLQVDEATSKTEVTWSFDDVKDGERNYQDTGVEYILL